MEVTILQKIKNNQVHFSIGNNLIASENLNLCFFDSEQGHWRTIAKASVSLIRRGQTYSHLFSRLIRGGIHAAIPVDEQAKQWIYVAEGQLHRVDIATKETRPFYKIPRGKRPLRRGLCVIDDQVLIGEYWGNPERTAVNIYKIAIATGEVETFYQFPAQTVRHVHTVDKDPYSNQLWVSTGDEDAECKIVLLDASTGESTLLGEGSQTWRTVSFAFRPDAVYWGTDNHLGHNEIWRYDRHTQATVKVGDVTGPVYYNACLDDAIIFGTTMEKGEGQQDGYGRLYAVDEKNNIQEVWKMAKDKWSAHYFGYGVFEFAEGSAGKNKFWVTAKGFEGGLQSILIELKHE